MSSTTPKSLFWLGARDSTPFIFVAGPFGVLFGVLAAEAGLSIVEVLTFSATVFAGAAQFTALQLMQEEAPTIIVLISALAVNLRVAMYSASLTPYLGAAPMWQRALMAFILVDQSYALSVVKFETEPQLSIRERVIYYFGTSSIITPLWFIATYVGATAGRAIPESWALDFALPIAFIAMIGPMLRTPAHRVAAVVACLASTAAAGMPYNLGLIVAGLLGMIAGAQAELWFERRRAVDR